MEDDNSSRKNQKTISSSVTLSSWSKLSTDPAFLILERLPLSDYIRFASVCKNWLSIQKEHRRLHSPNPPPMLKSLPWLISNLNNNQTEKVVHCYADSKSIQLKFPNPTLRIQFFSCSKGWLFFINELKHVSLLNPITSFQIHLPALNTVQSFNPHLLIYGSLSTSPVDPNCIALIFDPCYHLAYMCRIGKKQGDWTSIHHSYDTENQQHNSCHLGMGVVYCGSKFYCFSQGLLSVIDPAYANPSRQILNMDGSQMFDGVQFHYLVEFRGELMVVAALFDAMLFLKEFQVFKADFSRKKWIRMNDVGDCVFFISAEGPLCLSAYDLGCINKCVYYKDMYIRHNAWRVFDMDLMQWTDGPPFLYDGPGHWFLPSLDYDDHA